MPGRDIVCIGDWAGGTKALIDFLGALPDAAAAIFVVVHTSPQGGGLLAEVLERGGTLWELGRQEVARDVEQQAKQTELRASTIRRLPQVERPAVERKQADQAADAGYAKRVVEPRPGTRTRKTNR